MTQKLFPILVFGVLSHNCFADGKGWPAHWWANVPKAEAQSWEILPQEAGPGEVILSKRNELGLLSNFAPTPFLFRGQLYASLEGFWQAMLYPEGPKDPRARAPGLVWEFSRTDVEKMTAFEAKRAGDLAFANMKKMGINWVSFSAKRFDYWTPSRGQHFRLIVEAMGEKVRQNPKVKEVLLATEGLVLRPDHRQESGAPPAWRYFEILTDIREELLAGQRLKIDINKILPTTPLAFLHLPESAFTYSLAGAVENRK